MQIDKKARHARGPVSVGAALLLIASALVSVYALPAPVAGAAQSPSCSLAKPQVLNGSFEYPKAPPNGQSLDVRWWADPPFAWQSTKFPPQDPSGLKVFSSSQANNAARAPDGVQYLDLGRFKTIFDTDPMAGVGDIYQDIDTLPGEALVISGRTARDRNPAFKVEVFAGDPATPVDQLPKVGESPTPTASKYTRGPWTAFSVPYTVPAGQTKTRIRLATAAGTTDGGGSGANGLIDDVWAGPQSPCDDSVTMKVGETKVVPVLANDLGDVSLTGATSAAGVTATVGTGAQAGTVRLVASATANADSVQVPYTVSAPGGFTGSGVINVRVTPELVDDSATTGAGRSVSVDVLGNDAGAGLAPVVLTQPTHGTATVNAGRIDYAPNAGWSGQDSFTYNVTGPGASPPPAPATVTVTVTPAADLSVILGASTPASPSVGDSFSFPVTVANAGGSAAVKPSVRIPLPAGVAFAGGDPNCVAGPPVTCTVPGSAGTGVASGASVVFNPHFTASTTGAKAFTATVASSTADPTPGNNSASTTVTVATLANLRASNGRVPGGATPGSPITWTVDLSNSGPNPAGSVSVVLTYPDPDITNLAVTVNGGAPVTCTGGAGQITCPVGTLASGATATVSATGDLDAGSSAAAAIFAATVASGAPSSVPDPDVTDNTAVWGATVTPDADVQVTGALATATPLVPGGPVQFDLTVTNNGPSTAHGPHLRFPVPSGVKVTTVPAGCRATAAEVKCAFADLAAGADTGTLSFVGDLSHFVTADVGLTATAGSATTDLAAGNNSVTVMGPVAPGADIDVSMTSSPASPGAGGPEVVSLDVANLGPSTATAVSVDVTLPAEFTLAALPAGCSGTGPVTCAIASLPGFGSNVFQISGTWTQAGAGARSFTATRTASAPTDPDAANDTATLNLVVATVSDLSVAGSVSPSPVTAGASATVDVTVTDDGPSDVTGATVAVTLPAGITVGTSLPSGCSGSGAGPVTCTLAALTSGDSAQLTIPVEVDPTFTGTATFTATTAPPGGATDPSPGNDTATFDDTLARTDLQLASVPGLIGVSGYSAAAIFLIGNAGPSDIDSVPISFDLPAGSPFVQATGAQCTPSASDPQHLDCLTPKLAAGGVASVVVEMGLDAGATGTLTVQASIASGGQTGFTYDELNAADNTAVETLAIVAPDQEGGTGTGQTASPAAEGTPPGTSGGGAPLATTGREMLPTLALVFMLLGAGITLWGAGLARANRRRRWTP
jgi:hypothetical protein